MKNILFVCTGNTCRSPMAEAIFNDFAKKQNLQFTAKSCGIYGDGISKLSQNASKVLSDMGIEFEHVSTPIDEKLVSEADYIFGMTKNHGQAIISLYPKYSEKVYALTSDISDPFGGDCEVYKNCLSQIIDNVNEIIFKLSKGEK